MSFYDRSATTTATESLGPAWLERRPGAYEPSRLPARLAIVGIGIASALSLVTGATVVARAIAPAAIERPSQVAAELTFTHAAGVPFLIAALVLAAPAFVWWQVVFFRNVSLIGGPSAPSWVSVVLGWVIPVRNLVVPGLRMLDAGNRLDVGGVGRAVIIAWWVTWLASIGLSVFKTSLGPSVVPDVTMRLAIVACGALSITMIVWLDGRAERLGEERGLGDADDERLIGAWMVLAALPLTAIAILAGTWFGQPSTSNDFYRQRIHGEAATFLRMPGDPITYRDNAQDFQISYPAWWQALRPAERDGAVFGAYDLRGAGRDGVMFLRRKTMPIQLSTTDLATFLRDALPAGSTVDGSNLPQIGAVVRYTAPAPDGRVEMGYVFHAAGNQYNLYLMVPAEQVEAYQPDLRALGGSIHFSELD